MPIKDRNLTPGTILSANYKKQVYTCTLVETEEGPRYELESGKRFKSPSAAGSEVMNGTACNGWAFWSRGAEDGEAETAQEPKVAVQRTKATKTKLLVQVKKARKQDGAPEGMVSWFCSACQDGFQLAKNETPKACPEGHPRQVEDELEPPAGLTEAAAE